MNIIIELMNGSAISYDGEYYNYLNWLDNDDCFVVIFQHNVGGTKEIVKYPRRNVVYIHSSDEPAIFDALKGIVG